MKIETPKAPSFHPDSLNDDRLFIHLGSDFIGYCPRTKTQFEYHFHSEQSLLRHPVSLIEFVYHYCSGSRISNTDKTALYLAAKAVEAEMAGDHDEAKRLKEQHQRLMQAKKNAGEIIADSGIEKELHEYGLGVDVPF